MNIQLLLTGNEIMSGHTVDSNSALIAEKLLAYAYPIYRKVTIGDDLPLLIDEIKSISSNSDVLIINGGLGPTIDDLTAEALSQATNSPLTIHEQALKHVSAWCKKRQYPLNNSGRKQAILPDNISIINNPTGSAVGFYCMHNNCLIICTPGVPSELRAMLDESIVDLIAQQFPKAQIPATIRLQTFGLGESTIQELVNEKIKDWPPEVELGFRAGMPQLEIKLSINDKQHAPLQQACYQKLYDIIGDSIIGEESCKLAEAVIEELKAKKQRVCTAESCTGGLIASLITEIAGASTVFEAGVVSYSNDSKQNLLHVNKNNIDKYGAVSEETVRAMADGALEATKANYAMAVSGIAGPEGGSNEKPVGTVCIAWGKKGDIKAITLLYPMPRQWFQQMVAAISLDLLRRDLKQITSVPEYIKRYQLN